MAEQILGYLESARQEGSVTPNRPLSGEKIARRFGLKNSTETREVMHEIRSAGFWLARRGKSRWE